jgi:hypothetical protein
MTTVGIPLALGLVAAAVVVFAIVGGGKHRRPSGSGGTVSAQNVVGSIGVNVHMSYLDTSYARFPQIEQRLKALGVRTVRDGACSGCKQENQRLQQLGAAGIKLDLIMGDPRGQTGTLPQLIGLVRGPLAPFVTSVEGPNEYDNQGDPKWLPRLKAYQRQLYDAIKRDPKLRHIQVVGPSLVRSSSYAQLGNIDRMLDAGNLHPYPPNGGPPAANIAQELRLASTIAPGRSVQATETGYRTGGPPQPGNRPLTEQQEAAYLPALVLEYYRAGIRRSFLYELADEKPDPQGKDPQQHYGLLRQDLSPKPAYSALQNLIGLLSSAGPAKGSLDAPRATASSIDGSPIHTLTIQRGDGSQVLAMWLTSPTARDALAGRGRTHPVQLALGDRAAIDVYRPSLGKGPQQRLRPTTEAKIQLGADPVLAVIKSPR